MKKFVLLSFILFLFGNPHIGFAEAPMERVLVHFRDQVDETLLQNESIEVHHIFHNLSAISVTMPQTLISHLEENSNIISIEKEPLVEINRQSTGWGYRHVLGKESKQYGWTGNGVKVGIIDTGVTMDHPDLRIAGGVSFVSESYEDDEGHGTHVAGIIGAMDNEIGVVGIAPEAELYAIKSLNSAGIGILSDVIAGINWAVENDMDIVNLSLTTVEDHILLKKAIDDAYRKGLLIIAASGNTNTTMFPVKDILYPARYDSVIAVGSINDGNQKSSFSVSGQSLEFVAPGEKIYSTFKDKGYTYLDGTSMAAPYLSGIAALYKQAYPEYNEREIRHLMQVNAIDLGTVGKDEIYGYGLIQAPTTKNIFIDVSADKWYADEIAFLYEQEIITGYQGHTFLPNRPVTRAEAITMIGRALNYEGNVGVTNFNDVASTHYASGYIKQASKQQIINGYPNGSFQPNGAVIRGDVAAMLQRAFDFTASKQSSYTDVKEELYYYEPIHALTSNSIATGYPDGTFRPKNEITRAEFSVFLARVLDESFRP
jgi:hypothetical protein